QRTLRGQTSPGERLEHVLLRIEPHGVPQARVLDLDDDAELPAPLRADPGAELENLLQRRYAPVTVHLERVWAQLGVRLAGAQRPQLGKVQVGGEPSLLGDVTEADLAPTVCELRPVRDVGRAGEVRFVPVDERP